MFSTFGIIPTYETLTKSCLQGKERILILREHGLGLLSKEGQETLWRIDNIAVVLDLIKTRVFICAPFQTEEELLENVLLFTGLDYKAAVKVTKTIIESDWIPMLEENCYSL